MSDVFNRLRGESGNKREDKDGSSLEKAAASALSRSSIMASGFEDAHVLDFHKLLLEHR